MGYLDKTIINLSGKAINKHRRCSYKMVDTCAAQVKAQTPYYYSNYDDETEAKSDGSKKKIIVFGSGPIRIGQGIEFDYASVHCVWSLKKLGYEAIIANNNPETVSTDFDTSDRLYFEPLTPEDVDNIIETEKPYGVIVQFGGQTAIKLTHHLQEKGVNILGTSADMIDAAEDRKRFDKILEDCGIPRPAGSTAFTEKEAVAIGNELGYPVLVRPSYVLGGQGMVIAHDEEDVREYMRIINRTQQEHPILIDKYMMGKELEVDAIFDGEDIVIPGIMEHLERAGVHSGDSISVYPTQTIAQKHKDTICDYTYKLAKALNTVGLVNIQFVIYNDTVYVIEVNPRSSRTVPYISKVTNVPMVDLAARCILGGKLKDMGCQLGLIPEGEYVAVKVPVFSFEKLHDVDTHLGPEMKSTGEVLGIAKDFKEALLKGLAASGLKMKRKGGVLFSLRDSDKQEAIPIASRFADMGFELYATAGTAKVLNSNMIATNVVRRIGEDEPNIMNLLESGKVDYVISTSKHGRQPARDSVKIRRKTVERMIPCLTSLDTALALVKCLNMNKKVEALELIDINMI
jgi:carbamoyl-phosphate synthase large subunit